MVYRYGFNGKEKDPEFQNNYDYGFRIYNANIAKFLSVDPLSAKYSFLTPYQFASNSPISAVDLDGLEAYFAVSGRLIGKFGKDLSIRIVTEEKVEKQIKDEVKQKMNSVEKEFDSYKMSNNELKEILNQYDKTINSSVPIGYSAVIDPHQSLGYTE